MDSDGRFAFPSTHPLNLTNAREEALRGADVVLALDVPSLGVPLGPSVRERGNFAPIIAPSCKVIHITLLDLERQSWVSDNMWLLPVHVPMAADTAVALPQLLEQVRERLSATRIRPSKFRSGAPKSRRSIARRARKARSGSKKPGTKNRFPRRASSARSTSACKGRRGRWCRRTDGAGAKSSRSPSRPMAWAAAAAGASATACLPPSARRLGFKESGRLCVSILGDGDFLMTSNALWTAAKYQIPLLVVVLNNRSYYNDEEHQERMARARQRPIEKKGIGIRIEEPAPDLAAIARALERGCLRPDHRTGSARTGARQSDRHRRERQAGGGRRDHAAAVGVRVPGVGCQVSGGVIMDKLIEQSLHALLAREGLEPKEGDLEEFAKIIELYMGNLKTLHSVDLGAEEVAGVFRPEWTAK